MVLAGLLVLAFLLVLFVFLFYLLLFLPDILTRAVSTGLLLACTSSQLLVLVLLQLLCLQVVLCSLLFMLLLTCIFLLLLICLLFVICILFVLVNLCGLSIILLGVLLSMPALGMPLMFCPASQLSSSCAFLCH